MIDLSFLTEEEQETIRAVLSRDAELKKVEERRIQNLQRTMNDKGQLKYLTGEWFYVTKQLRHRDRIHGSDIIRASMRHRHTPLTIFELSQMVSEKSSFVCSDNKEVFVPPVLGGILQEPEQQVSSARYQNQPCSESPEGTVKPVVEPPTKRKNPFDNKVSVEEKNSHFLDGVFDQTQASNERISPSSHFCISNAAYLKEDVNESLVQHNMLASIPENTAVYSTFKDCHDKKEKIGDRQAPTAANPGILKNLPIPCPTNALLSHLTSQSPLVPDFTLGTCAERKQVRFSSALRQNGKEWQDGMELGKYSQLDTNTSTFSEALDAREHEKTDKNITAITHRSSLKQTQINVQDGELGCEYDGHQVEQKAKDDNFIDVLKHCDLELTSPAVTKFVFDEPESGKPIHVNAAPEEDVHSLAEAATGHSIHSATTLKSKTSCNITSCSSSKELLGNFTKEKKNADDEVMDQWENKELVETQNLFKDPANLIPDIFGGFEEETKLLKVSEVRTLQLTALQNTPFKDTVTSVHTDTLNEEVKSAAPSFPQGLRAVWKKENNDSRIYTEEEEGSNDIPKTKTEASRVPQTNSDMSNPNNNLSSQTNPKDEEIVGQSPLTDCSFFGNLLNENGTYRANPVLVCEEMDDSNADSLPEIQIHGQENISKDQSIPVQCSSHSTPSSKEERPVKIRELKHFWEKEYTGSKIITERFKEDSPISSTTDKAALTQYDRGTTSDTKCEGKAQAYQTIKAEVHKPQQVTDMDFISQDRNRDKLWSPYGTTKVPSGQVETQAESQERSWNPSEEPPRLTNYNNEVRRSPSKTCHPKVLPRESLSATRSRHEGSPLKTFPIMIHPQTERNELEKFTPTQKQRSPSHLPKQRVPTDQSTIDISLPVRLHPADLKGNGQQNCSNSTSLQSNKASAKMSGTFTHLVRSFIPEDYQHYLGPHNGPLSYEEDTSEESEAIHRTQRVCIDSLSRSSSVGDSARITSCNVRNKDNSFNQDPTTRSWSLPPTTSSGYGESLSPIVSTLKQLPSRSRSSTKSLENLTSKTGGENNMHNPREQVNLSADDVSSVPPSELMRTSVSVPVLQQDETDSDSTFETNLRDRRNTSSSTSDISLSSGMASMSSVSGSMSSIFPSDFADVEVQGSIQFAVNYIQKLGEFHIFVVLCRGLAVADTKKNRSDPYVKCYLLPDKTRLGKRKTTVKKKTLIPTYNEILRFKILMEVLKTQNLNVSVWHNDTFGRNSFLGEVDVQLSEWDFSNTRINDYALKARVSEQTSPSDLPDNRGQMRVALRFLPRTSRTRTPRMEAGEVQIWVKDCKNLPPVRGIIIDPFVKCAVLPDISRKSRQKTRVVKRTANPMFNHTMVYDGFRSEDLREACAEITVWDHDRLNNHYIGGLRLGLGTGRSYGVEVSWMDSTINEASLWQRMLQADGEWVEDVLSLRMLVLAKNMSK